MLETIEKNGMVKTREEGYQKVLDTLDGTFAFIDESARVSHRRLSFELVIVIARSLKIKKHWLVVLSITTF